MFLIFEVGGTKMRLASSFDGENLHDIKIYSTPQDFEQAFEIWQDFIGKSSDLTSDGNLICLGLPGTFDKAKKMLVSAPNLPFWITKPIKQRLEESTKSKVYLVNDASLNALGEATKGVGRKSQIVAFITIGTGVGGSRIVNGKIDSSVWGFEPGHQVINADVVIGDRMIDWEGLVSGVGIRTRYGQKPEEIKDPEKWKEVEKFIAIGMANTILHWSPDLLVCGGSVMRSEFISIKRIHETVSQLLKGVFPSVPEIKLGTLGDHSGIWGGLEYLKIHTSL